MKLEKLAWAVVVWGLVASALPAAPPSVTYDEYTDMGASNGVREWAHACTIDIPSGCEVYWIDYGWTAPAGADSQSTRVTYNRSGPDWIDGGPTFQVPDFSGEWTFWMRIRYYTASGGDDTMYTYYYVTVP